MRKNNIEFQAGDPLPASKHNGLVAASEETGAAFGGEHDALSGHKHIRFEYAILAAEWDGGRWVDVFGDRAFVDATEDRTVFNAIIQDEDELFSYDHLGIIIQDSDGYVIPYSTVIRSGEIVVTIHPRAQSTEVTMIVFGRRGFDTEKVRGISWADGSPAYALAGDHIGAEHANAACDWTRRYEEAALREHNRDGHHFRGYHCIGAVTFLMPTWSPSGPGGVYPPRILEGQLYEHEHWSYAADPGGLFSIQAGTQPSFRVTTDIPLPQHYRIMVANTPEPFIYGDAQGGGGIGGRLFASEVIDEHRFNLKAGAIGPGGIIAGAGQQKKPITVRIYAEPRDPGGSTLDSYVRHRLVEGGLGDVIPVEVYQGIADFQRSTVDHLDVDHDRDWRTVGVPNHESMRWFKAVSYFEVIPATERDESPSVRTYFAHGFKKAPEIRFGTRGQGSIPSWWVEWEANPKLKNFMFGIRLRLGPTPFSHPTRGQIEEDGKGWFRLGGMVPVLDPEEEIEYFEPSDALLNIRGIVVALF